MINWEQIKDAYIRSNVSLRALAKQFGVMQNQIYYRAMRDGWQAEKKAFLQAQEQEVSLAESAQSEKCGIDAEDIGVLTDKLYKKANLAIDALSDEGLDTQRLRHLVQSVKDLKDLAKQEEGGKDQGKLEALIKGLCQIS